MKNLGKMSKGIAKGAVMGGMAKPANSMTSRMNSLIGGTPAIAKGIKSGMAKGALKGKLSK